MKPLRTPWLAMLIVSILLGKKLLAADIQQWQHGPEAPQVIELFTSEGCYSCPPADAWLSGLKQHPKLWKGLYPMALHVYYWNYLGWQDRFSRAEFSQRQRRYAREGHLGTVYTPGLVVDGREWKAFFSHRTLPTYRKTPTGILSLQREGEQVRAHFQPAQTTMQSLEFNLILLGFDIRSPISGGENQGKLLRHDFLVLHKQNATVSTSTNGFLWTAQLPALEELASPKLALLSWVNKPDELTPLQAAGGPLQ